MSTGSLALALPSGSNLCILNLAERNRMAHKVITDYAQGHAAGDIAVGLIGTFIPGMALPAMIGAIVAQAPLVYTPMAKKLSAIYTAQPDEITAGYVNEAAMIGAGADVAVELGTDFFVHLAPELLSEVGLGGLVTLIPFIGGMLGAGIDAMVASTLTWRVGTMVSMYHQHGDKWLDDSQNATYHRAKDHVGEYLAKTENRVDLNDLPHRNKEILDKHLGVINHFIDVMLPMGGGKDKIREILINSKKMPAYLVDIALAAIPT
jgi:hypothetical protein